MSTTDITPLWAARLRRFTLPSPQAALLLSPALLFLGVFLILPGLTLLGYSVMTQHPDGSIGAPLNLEAYKRLMFHSNYRAVALQTIEISLWTTAITIVMAFPLAMVITFGNGFYSRLTIVVVVMPMVVSVIVRTYGWQLLLGNGPNGVLNWIIRNIGIEGFSLKLLYTKWAVVVASAHVFLPLVVLPIATSLSRINPALNPAARMLGATPLKAFLKVTLPLSVPGLAIGTTIVFSLTAASYITPAMIGGSKGLMLGILLEQQMTATYDWPMGAAIGVIMVAIILAVNVGIGALLDRRMRRSSATR